MKKQTLLLLFSTITVAVSISGCNNSKSETDTTTLAELTTEVTTEIAQNVNVSDVTLDAFVEKFNETLPDTFSSINLNPVYESSNDNGDVYTASINNSIEFTFNIKNNIINGVMITKNENLASDTDGTLFLSMMHCTIKSLNPSISSEDLNKLTITMPIDLAAGGATEENINGVDYMFSVIPGTGSVFVANLN